MSTICVEITLTYRNQTYTQCEEFDLDVVRGPEQYHEELAAYTRVMIDEVVRRYEVEDVAEIEIKCEITDTDKIPEWYLLSTANNFTPKFWQINLTRYYDRNKVKLPEEAYYAADTLGIAPERVKEVYQGYWESDEDFAYDMAESRGMDMAAWPLSTIDWERAASALMQDFREFDGYYFRN